MKSDKRKMWQSPWLYRESIVFVLGIIIIGFILQYAIGRFNFYLFSAPNNLIIGGCMIVLLVIFSLARKTSFYQWFSGIPFSVTLIVALLLLGLIMGITPQLEDIDPYDRNIFTLLGFRQVTSSWPFVLIYIFTLLSLGALITRRLIHFKIRDYAFYFNHIGLWILLFAGGLGVADMKRYIMYVKEGEIEWRAYDRNKGIVYLPVAIQLNDFDMEVYPPKLAIMNFSNDILQSASKPEYFQISEKEPNGIIGNWSIKLKEYIHQAVPNGDGTYREANMPGASPAANITATNMISGDIRTGWVCCGSMAQSHAVLLLDSKNCIVMSRPEPKRFFSDIDVFMRDGGKYHTILEVNKPFKIAGWMIYQHGYDNRAGRMSAYSSIELVYDPWLYPVYLGIILLAAGSICLICFGSKKRKSYDMG